MGGEESSPSHPGPQGEGCWDQGITSLLTVWALTRLYFPTGHRRSGAPAADSPYGAGVHGAEAGARHQVVPSDRESESGFLRPVCQLTPPSGEVAHCLGDTVSGDGVQDWNFYFSLDT